MSDPRSVAADAGASATVDTQDAADPSPAFAHASEAELSRILDFYAVRWEYEPRVFPILWNTEGEVLESFAPDFYLPDLDLYVELTTLRQKLVRKKNRKLRRLRELYPDVNIKLFYARDFRALMLKYGRLTLAEELTGTSGQVTPERTYDDLLAGPFGPLGRATGAAATPEAETVAEAETIVHDPPTVAPRRRRRRHGRSAARSESAGSPVAEP